MVPLILGHPVYGLLIPLRFCFPAGSLLPFLLQTFNIKLLLFMQWRTSVNNWEGGYNSHIFAFILTLRIIEFKRNQSGRIRSILPKRVQWCMLVLSHSGLKFSINPIRKNASCTVIAIYLHTIFNMR